MADGLQPFVINNEVAKDRYPAGLLTGACLGQGLPVEKLSAPTRLETEREGERAGERERQQACMLSEFEQLQPCLCTS